MEHGSAQPRAARYHREAIRSFQQKQPEDALVLLSFAFENDPDFRPPYATAVEVLESIGWEDEANLFRDVIDTFNEARTFHRLGHHFFDQGDTRLAIPFLERAVQLDPDQAETLTTLAISLGSVGRLSDSRAILQKHPQLDQQFWPYFEFIYSSFLLGHLDQAKEGLARIRDREPEYRETVNREELNEYETSIDRLEGGIRRYRNLTGRNDRSIRDWHYIQYGAVVVDLLDDRFQEGAFEVAGGRFAGFWADASMLLGTLLSLRWMLEVLDLDVDRILHAPDRDSAILARILGNLLERPYAPLEGSASREDSLVVVASSLALNEMNALLEREPGEVLYCHHLCWPQDCLVVPDLTGLLAQFHFFPWSDPDPIPEEIAFDLPADPRSPDEIANEILRAEPFDPPVTRDEHLTFYLEHRRELCVGDWIQRPMRSRYISNSPVPGWRFV